MVMLAYKIDREDRKKATAVDLGYDFSLPSVACPKCSRSVGHWSVAYPTISPDLLPKQLLTGRKVVSLEEFEELKQAVFRSVGRKFNLVPGGLIGPPSGKILTPLLDDFAWGLVNPLVSRKAVELLRGEGIVFRSGDIKVTYRGRTIDSHVAIQIEPVSALTSNCLHSLPYNHCAKCGNFHLDVLRRTQIPIPLEFDIARVPVEPLYKVIGPMENIASANFIAAYKKLGLSGLAFVECGRYV